MKPSFLVFFFLFTTSCGPRSIEEWENVKTAARYLERNIQSLLGTPHEKSRQLLTNADFDKPNTDDKIPLYDRDLENSKPELQDVENLGEKNTVKHAHKEMIFDHYTDVSKKYGDMFPLLHFAKSSCVLDREKDRIAVEKIAAFLKQKPAAQLVIEGHCDQQDTADDLLALGRKRANHVRLLLTKKGVDPEQIYTISYGETKPLVQGSSEQSFRLNRRAEFKLFIEE